MPVISFTNVVPPLRYDGLPWTKVEIAEAATLAGPWTVLETQTLTSPDTDPTQPAERDVTTNSAVLLNGLYMLTFIDAAGGRSQAVEQTSDATAVVRPTVRELGAFMRARTVSAGTGGSEVGTFDTTTRPTAQEADEIIDLAVSEVLTRTGEDTPDRFVRQTAYVVLLYAAMLVELTFYRNEITRDQSAYGEYQALYKDGIDALGKAIADEGPAGDQPGFVSVPVMNAQQARFQAIVGAYDPVTAKFDPTKLPPDLYYPYGPGGIPPWLIQIMPWFGMGFGAGGGLDEGLAFLED